MRNFTLATALILTLALPFGMAASACENCKHGKDGKSEKMKCKCDHAKGDCKCKGKDKADCGCKEGKDCPHHQHDQGAEKTSEKKAE